MAKYLPESDEANAALESGALLRDIDWQAFEAPAPEDWSSETKRVVEALLQTGALEAVRNSSDSVAAFANRRLEHLEEELKRAERVRDDFMSIASHELKTPITALRLQLQLTRRGVNPETNLVPSPAKLAAVLDLASRQTDRLMHLIEDLVDAGRIEAGKLQYRFEEVNLRALAEEVLACHAGQSHPPRLMPAAAGEPEPIASCDRDRVSQVLNNFLSNALKYGGGLPAEVRIEKRGSSVAISVRDFGLGIPKEKQSLIFDRFERAVSHQYISGVGLGLYISKQIAEAHEGRILLDSEEGRGSTFTLLLPVQRATVSSLA